MIDPSTLDLIPFLAALGPAAKRELAARGARVHLGEDEVLWTAGGRPRGLFVVLEGEVRVVRARGGRQRVVHTEGPGGTLGEVPLFAGGPYPATAVAARETVCLAFGRDAIEAAVRADPALAFTLLARLAERVRTLVERLDRVSGLSVESRLAGHLLSRLPSSDTGEVTLGARQESVAEELGTVREVLVRALRRLRQAGLVQPLGRGRYRIADVDALRAVASGDPLPRSASSATEGG